MFLPEKKIAESARDGRVPHYRTFDFDTGKKAAGKAESGRRQRGGHTLEQPHPVADRRHVAGLCSLVLLSLSHKMGRCPPILIQEQQQLSRCAGPPSERIAATRAMEWMDYLIPMDWIWYFLFVTACKISQHPRKREQISKYLSFNRDGTTFLFFFTGRDLFFLFLNIRDRSDI